MRILRWIKRFLRNRSADMVAGLNGMWPKSKQLWAYGHLICLNCEEEHVSVWPVGYEPLPCPHCGDEGCCLPWGGFVGEGNLVHNPDFEELG